MKRDLLTAVCLAAAWTVHADNFTWVPGGGATSSFQDGANWNKSGAVPGTSDNALFTAAGTYGVTFNGGVTNTGATAGSSGGTDVAFDLNGSLWKLTGNLVWANSGTARFGGGRLEIAGSAVGANQTLVLESGTSSFSGSLQTTGAGGAVQINGGTHDLGAVGSWDGLILNTAPSGGTSLRMTNGTVNITGAANINAGAKVSLEGGTFLLPPNGNGLFVNGSGRLDVYTNAALDCRDRFYVGPTAGAQSTLNILGGTVTNTGAAVYLGVGKNVFGATGAIHLAEGIFYSSQPVFVGGHRNDASSSNSVGILHQSGGRLSVPILCLGSYDNSVGVYTQEGGTAYCTGIQLGNKVASARGEIYRSNGTLETPGTIYVGYEPGTTGCLHQTGGELIACGVTVGSASSSMGELFVAGGTLSVTGQYAVFVGGTATAVGRVTISGGTNRINSFYLGHSGNGLLRVTGGHIYLTNGMAVGSNAGGTGRLEVAGGTLTVKHINGGNGYAEALLDGGVLQCSGDSSSASFASFDRVTLTDRGAVIDTAGRDLTFNVAFLNEPGYAGSFTKRGAGRLTLTSYSNTFTGQVAVAGGELAVSGAVYLTGGVAVDAGALLNLTGAIYGTTTASGTASRVDGVLALNSGVTLTAGPGSALGGCGAVTGSVAFAAGSAYGRDKASGSAALQVAGNVQIEAGATVALTGYSVAELEAGIPLVTAAGAGALQLADSRFPVTLDGASSPEWWAVPSGDGRTLTTRVIRLGTMIRLQ